MKNKKEREEFIDNPENWDPVEVTSHARISEITYKGESRYKLETLEEVNVYDYDTHERYRASKWIVKTYYKENALGWKYGLESQSLTEVREWVSELDRKGKA